MTLSSGFDNVTSTGPHTAEHPGAGRTFTVHPAYEHQLLVDGAEFRLENWWDHETVHGASWMFAQGNPAALNYAMRSGLGNIPLDDEVVYGHVGSLGYLVHVSELGDEIIE